MLRITIHWNNNNMGVSRNSSGINVQLNYVGLRLEIPYNMLIVCEETGRHTIKLYLTSIQV